MPRTGSQELSPLHAQINKRETGNNRTWSATSVVQIPATRERHGETIKCVAIHESYATKSVSVEVKLDVKCECLISCRGNTMGYSGLWIKRTQLLYSLSSSLLIYIPC